MMAPERIASLTALRDQLEEKLAELQDGEPAYDDTKRGAIALKAWAQECKGFQQLIDNLNKVLRPRSVRIPVAAPRLTVQPAGEATTVQRNGFDVARIAKGKRAEMRVSINEWKGQKTIDVRLWFMPKTGGDWVPSRKGVSVEAGKLDALVQALVLAKGQLRGIRADPGPPGPTASWPVQE